jgi:hypothetical protein
MSVLLSESLPELYGYVSIDCIMQGPSMKVVQREKKRNAIMSLCIQLQVLTAKKHCSYQSWSCDGSISLTRLAITWLQSRPHLLQHLLRLVPDIAMRNLEKRSNHYSPFEEHKDVTLTCASYLMCFVRVHLANTKGH